MDYTTIRAGSISGVVRLVGNLNYTDFSNSNNFIVLNNNNNSSIVVWLINQYVGDVVAISG